MTLVRELLWAARWLRPVAIVALCMCAATLVFAFVVAQHENWLQEHECLHHGKRVLTPPPAGTVLWCDGNNRVVWP